MGERFRKRRKRGRKERRKIHPTVVDLVPSPLDLGGDCSVSRRPTAPFPVVLSTASDIVSVDFGVGGFWQVRRPRLRSAIASEAGGIQS